MALTYDFDIRRSMPKAVAADPKFAGMLDVAGMDADAGYVALFRDPATVQALMGADDQVRAYFEACGFGFETHDSGAGTGLYPAEDEAEVNEVAERLAGNIANFPLKGKNFNGFDMGAFCVHLAEMKAAPAPAPVAPTTAPVSNAGAGSPLERIQQKHAAQQAALREADVVSPVSAEDLLGPELGDPNDPNVGMPPAEAMSAAKKVKGAPRSGRVMTALVVLLVAAVGAGVGLEMMQPEVVETAEEGGSPLDRVMELIEGFTSAE